MILDRDPREVLPRAEARHEQLLRDHLFGNLAIQGVGLSPTALASVESLLEMQSQSPTSDQPNQNQPSTKIHSESIHSLIK